MLQLYCLNLDNGGIRIRVILSVNKQLLSLKVDWFSALPPVICELSVKTYQIFRKAKALPALSFSLS